MTPAQLEAPPAETSSSSLLTPREPLPAPGPAAHTDSTPPAPIPLPQLAPAQTNLPRTMTLDPESPPRNPRELGALLRQALGISIPARALRDSSCAAPLDYLAHAFFEGRRFEHDDAAADTRNPTDCVVWANRGGGKTFLGAVATMLDLVFKPGIQVRILGGSLEQSKRMQEHLSRLFEHDALASMLRPGRAGRAVRSITLKNGSRAEVLAASETSVRGVRVQKVRCDEVELFDPALWRAVQLTTRSLNVPGPWGSEVRGGIEALSTMHLPYGIMWELVGAGVGGSGELPAATPLRTLFRWGLIDALERCDDTRRCETCNLFDDCRGGAKAIAPGCGGHIHIADAQAQKRRVDIETWRSEMLCLEPRTHDLVYAEFDPRIHIFGLAGDEAPGELPASVTPRQAGAARPASSCAGDTIICRRAGAAAPDDAGESIVAGMDFGFRAETAILIGRLRHADNTLFIDHEIVAAQRTLSRHIDSIRVFMHRRGGVGAIRWLAADPAGRARNDQTGEDNLRLLEAAGIRTIAADNRIESGVQLVRSRLAPADGPPRLFIHARCTRLIESLRRYHYKPGDDRSQVPAKGKFDHACDALRYLVAAADARRYVARAGEW